MEQKPTITPTAASLHSLHARLGTLVVYRHLLDAGPFRQFADLDVFDLEVGSENPQDVIRFCQLLEPTIGGNGGKLKGGLHLAFPTKQVPTGNLLLSLLDQFDIHRENFGDSTGRLPGLV